MMLMATGSAGAHRRVHAGTAGAILAAIGSEKALPLHYRLFMFERRAQARSSGRRSVSPSTPPPCGAE